MTALSSPAQAPVRSIVALGSNLIGDGTDTSTPDGLGLGRAVATGELAATEGLVVAAEGFVVALLLLQAANAIKLAQTIPCAGYRCERADDDVTLAVPLGSAIAVPWQRTPPGQVQ